MRRRSARELVFEPARHHLQAEMQEVPEHRLQIQPLGPADLRVLGRDEAGEVHAEVDLQRRVLAQVRHDHLLVGVRLISSSMRTSSVVTSRTSSSGGSLRLDTRSAMRSTSADLLTV